MSSWRNRTLRALARKAGITPVRVGPGVLLLARGDRARVDRLESSMSVVSLNGRPRHRRVAEGAWLVQQASAPPIRVAPLDRDTFLGQPRGRPRRTRRIGSRRVRAHVVYDEAAVRANEREFLRNLGTFAGNEHIAWILRELEVNCVLDVGANIGQYAKRLRAAGYRGRIVSFEPVAEMAARLRHAAAGDPDWIVMETALGDAEGTAEIHAMQGAMSSLLPASDFGKRWSAKLRKTHPEQITIRRLDGVFDEAVAGIDRPRVYLKLDTQGFDLQAFAGAGARIEEVIGMQSEVSCVPIYDHMPRLTEQLSVYEDAGFELTGMFPVNIEGRTLRVIEFDAVMIRPAALPRRDGH